MTPNDYHRLRAYVDTIRRYQDLADQNVSSAQAQINSGLVVGVVPYLSAAQACISQAGIAAQKLFNEVDKLGGQQTDKQAVDSGASKT